MVPINFLSGKFDNIVIERSQCQELLLTKVMAKHMWPPGILLRADNHFRHSAYRFLLGITILLAVFIGIIDYQTGPYLSFSIFYLAPITFITWYGNRKSGIFVSFLCAVIWLVADVWTEPHYPHPLIPFWNASLRLFFFLIITYLLAALKAAHAREWRLARLDYLTGVLNHRAFYESAEKELQRLRRYGHPVSLSFIDLDHFKFVNDQLGHAAGDQVLITVGEVLRDNARSSDIAARLGGDEFVIMLPETDTQPALEFISRLKTRLLGAMESRNWPITFSIGIITFQTAPKTLEELVKTADGLMYEVKKNGKNNIRHQVFAEAKTV